MIKIKIEKERKWNRKKKESEKKKRANKKKKGGQVRKKVEKKTLLNQWMPHGTHDHIQETISQSFIFCK